MILEFLAKEVWFIGFDRSDNCSKSIKYPVYLSNTHFQTNLLTKNPQEFNSGSFQGHSERKFRARDYHHRVHWKQNPEQGMRFWILFSERKILNLVKSESFQGHSNPKLLKLRGNKFDNARDYHLFGNKIQTTNGLTIHGTHLSFWILFPVNSLVMVSRVLDFVSRYFRKFPVGMTLKWLLDFVSRTFAWW